MSQKKQRPDVPGRTSEPQLINNKTKKHFRFSLYGDGDKASVSAKKNAYVKFDSEIPMIHGSVATDPADAEGQVAALVGDLLLPYDRVVLAYVLALAAHYAVILYDLVLYK